MSFAPKVSIVIPVYNGAKYLREAIDSALDQTYKNIEVIVVNDGSIDGGKTEEIALSYGNRIRYFHKENGGVATALNLGIEEMTGEYFSWLSHDDVYHLHKVQCQVDYLNTSKDKDIILYSDFEFINDKSRTVALNRIQNLEPDEFRLALITGYPIHGCTALIPKKCFDTVGLFDVNLKTTQDYDLWFRMSGAFKFIHTTDILVKSRIHSEQGSRTIPNHLAECNSLYIKCLKEISTQQTNYSGEFLSAFFTKVSLSFFDLGFLDAARYSLELTLDNINEQKRYKNRLLKAVSAVNTGAKQLKIAMIGNPVFNGNLIGNDMDIKFIGNIDAIDKNSNNCFDVVLSYMAFSGTRDCIALLDNIIRILKPGGVLYIDYEVSPDFWSNIKTYNRYLKELGKRFDMDHLFNFTIEQSPLITRYYRKLMEVILLKDWKKLIRGVSRRIISSVKASKQSQYVFDHAKDCVDWGQVLQNISFNCDILVQERYLACRENVVPPEVWGKWNSQLSDSFLLIVQKRPEQL